MFTSGCEWRVVCAKVVNDFVVRVDVRVRVSCGSGVSVIIGR